MGLVDDLNDLVRSPDGKVAEAKVFAVAFKVTMIWAFIRFPEAILASWDVLSVFVAAMIAPDVLKKIISQRAGIQEEKK